MAAICTDIWPVHAIRTASSMTPVALGKALGKALGNTSGNVWRKCGGDKPIYQGNDLSPPGLSQLHLTSSTLSQ